MRITLEKAIQLLKAGEVVAIPTETVYGLAVCLSSHEGIKKIYQLKNRPADNPLIVHIASKSQLLEFVHSIPKDLGQLIEKFWPGPLTFILPADEKKVPAIARAGLPNVAVRMPSHPLVRQLLEHTGPLVAPSANLSGKPSSTSPDHVEQDFGLDFPVLDGGQCSEGVESTILYYEGGTWRIARLGAISTMQLEELFGYTLALEKKSAVPLCPGQHYRHYAPKAKLILGQGPYPGTPEVVIGFSDVIYSNAKKVFELGKLDEPKKVMANLYHTLREVDRANIPLAWVDFNFPKNGLFQTLAERLTKASQG